MTPVTPRLLGTRARARAVRRSNADRAVASARWRGIRTPPHASWRRSMLRRLARRRATMFSLASMSREIGSMPFWLMTTKPLLVPSHTRRFSSMIFCTRSSVCRRSEWASLSRVVASL